VRTHLFALAFLLATGAPAASPPSGKPVLPFLENDYNKALSLAREKKVPIFVEAWAPW
jgi:hypothetical protein